MTQTSCVRAIWCVTVMLGFVAFASADVPSLEWDPNSEPTIAGYNVYVGEASGSYARVVDVGAETKFPLTNLNAGITYYFAVTAYDVNGLESPFSDEIWYTPRVDGTNSMLIPLELRLTPATASIQFAPLANQVCRVVASTDLVHWQQIHSVTNPTGGLLQMADIVPAGQPQRFYRVVGTR